MLVLAMVIGAAIGIWRARVVEMTGMPELIAMMHSFVGLAAVLVGYNSYLEVHGNPVYEDLMHLSLIHISRLVQYSAALYQRLEAETGLGTGYKECGGVTVARTPERMVQLLRTAAAAEAYNLECEILTPAQAADRYPLLRTDDLQGAIWLPKDATANPTDVTQSLAKGAKLRGARVVEKVRVTGLDIRDGLAAGVRTDQGDVECETLVLCAGQWTNALAATIGVTVPLHSAEHFYVCLLYTSRCV